MKFQVWERGQVDPRKIPDDVLHMRLAEAIAWTHHLLQRPGFAPSMRTADLQWRILHCGRDDVVCEIGAARQFELRRIHGERRHSCPDLLGGRLLVYFPDDDLCDGAAEQETEGFSTFSTSPLGIRGVDTSRMRPVPAVTWPIYLHTSRLRW